ncbi:MAG: hypothetical protein LBC87_10205 [Fibromonadaceae bacterium]|jgi:hypothetical protein|nr:hypothetical protein [Fibromonadaceae bacterium]
MLVLKQFELNKEADTFLKISGRNPSVLTFLFSLMGLEPVTNFEANKKEVKFETVSVRYGKKHINIPNNAITGIETGWRKPFSILVIAVVVFLGSVLAYFAEESLMPLTVIGIVISVICFISYFRNKTLFFGVTNGESSKTVWLEVKRSVIENVSIDFDKFEEAATVLNEAVLNSRK